MKNIPDFTIAEAMAHIATAEELNAAMNMETLPRPAGQADSNSPSIYDFAIGKYAIVRSRNEGINAGKVLQADNTGIILEDARRLHYYRPADEGSWYEGVANSGLRRESRISAPVKQKIIIEDYSITLCTNAAEQSIRGYATHEQQGND